MKLYTKILFLISLISIGYGQQNLWKQVKNHLVPINSAFGVNLRSGIYGTSGLTLGYSTEQDSGTIRYNAGSISYWNGSSWVTLSSSGGGAGSFTKSQIDTVGTVISGTWQAGIIDTTYLKSIRTIFGGYGITATRYNSYDFKIAVDTSIIARKADSTIISAGYGIGVAYSGHTATVKTDTSLIPYKSGNNLFTGNNYYSQRQYLSSEGVDTISAYSAGNKVYLQDTLNVSGNIKVGESQYIAGKQTHVFGKQDSSYATATSIGSGSSNYMLGYNNTIGRINPTASYGNWLFGQYLRSETSGLWAFGSDDNFQKKIIPFSGSVVFVGEAIRHWLSNASGYTAIYAPSYGIQTPHVADSALFTFRLQKLGDAIDTLAYPAVHYTIERGFSVSTLSNGEKYLIANTASRVKRIWSLNENNDDALHFNTLNTSGRPFKPVYVDSAGIIVNNGGITVSGAGSLGSLTLGAALDSTYILNAVANITTKGAFLSATRYNTKDFQLTIDTTATGLRGTYPPYSGATSPLNLGAQTLTTTGAGSFGALSGTTGTFSGTVKTVASTAGNQSMALINTNTAQPTLFYFAEVDNGTTPAYIQRFGSTHATTAGMLLINNSSSVATGFTRFQSGIASGTAFQFYANGSIRALIGADGALTLGTTAGTGTASFNAGAISGTTGTFSGSVGLGGGSTTTTILSVKNGLLANATEWYNSRATQIAKIDSVGLGTFVGLTTTGAITATSQTLAIGAITSSGALSLGTNTITSGVITASGKSVIDTVSTSHIIGKSAAPSIARGAGSGTTSTVGVVGTDIAGVITVSTAGTAPTANGIIATVTFAKTWTNPPYVTLHAASGIAAQEIAKVVVTSTGTTFVLTDTVTALTNAKLYKWYYHAFE